MSTCLQQLVTKDPHSIPGYTGYSPQYLYRISDTFGTQTHKLFIDPCVNHAEKLILSDKSCDDYTVERPPPTDIEIVERRAQQIGDTVYRHPLTPGYEGFVPRANGIYGQRFSVVATEGMSEFEQDCLKKRQKERIIRQRGAARLKPERDDIFKEYKYPLASVRPDCNHGIREIPADQLPKPAVPYSKVTPPCFMDNNNPEKYMKLGYSGHHPFAWPRFGQGNQPLSNSALCDFTNNYQHRRSTEWAPIKNPGVGASKPSGTIFEIYHRNTGLLPNYCGHVPGAMFRFGMTYGNDSRDAKRWLRGDFST